MSASYSLSSASPMPSMPIETVNGMRCSWPVKVSAGWPHSRVRKCGAQPSSAKRRW